MMECPGEYVLVQWVCDDLAADQIERIQTHVDTCGKCKKKTDEIRHKQSEYASRITENWNRLEAKLAKEKKELPNTGWWWTDRRLVFGALGVFSLVLLVFLTVSIDPQISEVQFKGNFAVRVVAKRNERQFVVKPGQQMQNADAIRFIVTVPTPTYLTVFSVNASGTISAFYPDSAPESEPEPMVLDQTGRHELPGSIVLDDSLGREWLVVMLSPKKFVRSKWHTQVGQTLTQHHSIENLNKVLNFDGSLFVLPITKVKGKT